MRCVIYNAFRNAFGLPRPVSRLTLRIGRPLRLQVSLKAFHNGDQRLARDARLKQKPDSLGRYAHLRIPIQFSCDLAAVTITERSRFTHCAIMESLKRLLPSALRACLIVQITS